jgi:hypothetical protein
MISKSRKLGYRDISNGHVQSLIADPAFPRGSALSHFCSDFSGRY